MNTISVAVTFNRCFFVCARISKVVTTTDDRYFLRKYYLLEEDAGNCLVLSISPSIPNTNSLNNKHETLITLITAVLITLTAEKPNFICGFRRGALLF